MQSNTDPSPFYHHLHSTAYVPKTGEEARILVRTPSPTPSEARELETGALDWKKLSNWRFWIRREWLWYYVALVIILVITALVTIYHKQIVFWLNNNTHFLHNKFGWLIPIGVLFVISFPPLFGHEIVAILCGLVWGMWIGFAIVAAGTFFGEVGNFYAFRYCCRARGAKMEKNNIPYACLARVVREGGFKIALIARLSAIPGHFTTAVFSTCGMGIFVFSLAAILSMPKQFITVYLGVLMEQSATGSPDTKSRIISDVVLAITILITFLAMWYIYHKMNQVKPDIIYERRKMRQAKLARAASLSSQSTFPSSDDISLTLKVQPPSIHHPSLDTDLDTERLADADPGYLYAPQPYRALARRNDAELGHAHAHTHGSVYPAVGRHSSGRMSTDDVSWDMSGVPMEHAGMGREVAGLSGYGYGHGYGYVGYETNQRGESAETLTGERRVSEDTVVMGSGGLRPGR